MQYPIGKRNILKANMFIHDYVKTDVEKHHAIKVSMIIWKLTYNEDLTAAALLHDILEDTDVTYEQLKEEFGTTIADLVNEVTHEGKPDTKGYYFPRLKTQEGYMIKFADRLHNLSRMKELSEGKQKHYLKTSRFWRKEEKVLAK